MKRRLFSVVPSAQSHDEGYIFDHQSVPSIVNETDAAQKALRVNISYAVGQVVKTAMGLLGIEVPERM